MSLKNSICIVYESIYQLRGINKFCNNVTSYQDQGVLALNVTLHFNKHTHTDIRKFQSRPTRLRSESDETDNEYITTFLRWFVPLESRAKWQQPIGRLDVGTSDGNDPSIVRIPRSGPAGAGAQSTNRFRAFSTSRALYPFPSGMSQASTRSYRSLFYFNNCRNGPPLILPRQE